MKLVGKVNGINRRAAEHTRGDQVSKEKRGFMVQLRPAVSAGSYFGYGSMDFYLNGREIEDFSVDLGDTLDIYLLKEGESGEFAGEDLRRRVHEAEAASATSAGLAKQYRDSTERLNGVNQALNEKLRAAATVNAQLMAQVEALKIGRMDIGGEQPLLSASAMSAFGQDPEEGLEAKPASATAAGGDAQTSGPILPNKERTS